MLRVGAACLLAFSAAALIVAAEDEGTQESSKEISEGMIELARYLGRPNARELVEKRSRNGGLVFLGSRGRRAGLNFMGSRGKRLNFMGSRGKRLNFMGSRGKRLNFMGSRGKRLNFMGSRGRRSEAETEEMEPSRFQRGFPAFHGSRG